ncbi:MAG: HAD family phosphatase [Fastidiosipila sp.]|nr:HAD family phosphatase [Fastidiosipila sp.]
MSKIKLLISDLDETILKKGDVVSERDQETVERLLDRGIEVVWITGRYYDSIPKYFTENKRIPYVASSNGALIHNVKADKVIYEKYLNYKDVLDIIRKVDEKASLIFVEAKQGVFVDERLYKNEILEGGNFFETLKKQALLKDDLYKFIKENKIDALKIEAAFHDLDYRNDIYRKLRELNQFKVSATHYSNVDVISKKASKGNALLYLKNDLGLKTEEIMAIGDNDNDVAMIKEAGIGVAMANGSPLIKDTADFISDSIENDGFSAAVRKVIPL